LAHASGSFVSFITTAARLLAPADEQPGDIGHAERA